MSNEQSNKASAADKTTDSTAENSSDTSSRSKSFYSSPRYLAIVERFKQELPDIVKVLSEAVRIENWDLVKDKSHELKGIGGAMGFPQITEIARQMYTQACEENYDQVSLTCAELEKECQSLVQSFKQVDS